MHPSCVGEAFQCSPSALLVVSLLNQCPSLQAARPWAESSKRLGRPTLSINNGNGCTPKEKLTAQADGTKAEVCTAAAMRVTGSTHPPLGGDSQIDNIRWEVPGVAPGMGVRTKLAMVWHPGCSMFSGPGRRRRWKNTLYGINSNESSLYDGSGVLHHSRSPHHHRKW